MKKYIYAAAFAVLSTGAQAAVFDFSWLADFAPTTPERGECDDDDCIDDELSAPAMIAPGLFASAIGTIEIDAGAGETFSTADIIASSVIVSGLNFADFEVNTWISAGGAISADGLSASFSASGNPYMADDELFFGCSNVGCSGGLVEIEALGFDYEYYQFASQEDALASMVMTRRDVPPPATVPLPAGAPLLLAGLAALGWTRRKS